MYLCYLDRILIFSCSVVKHVYRVGDILIYPKSVGVALKVKKFKIFSVLRVHLGYIIERRRFWHDKASSKSLRHSKPATFKYEPKFFLRLLN